MLGKIIIIAICLVILVFVFVTDHMLSVKRRKELEASIRKQQEERKYLEAMLNKEPWRAIKSFTADEKMWLGKLMEVDMFMDYQTAQYYVYCRRSKEKSKK